ncbi:MAG: Acylphosphatase [Methanonatronarchaeales archaeon]|nr:Acylphosphatase [Methanonatronarchaeales archaeon]
MDRAHVFVSGRVQGVFYRAGTRERARELGVSGWVRNLPDGRVEAVFEGEGSKVDEMLKWCRDGSAAARVETVEVEREEPKGLKGFEVRY